MFPLTRQDLRREGRQGGGGGVVVVVGVVGSAWGRKVKRGTYEFVDRRQEPKRFSRLPQACGGIINRKDLNDSGEAEKGTHEGNF